MKTLNRLANLIKADIDAGKTVQWLEIDSKDRATLIGEIRNEKTPLAKTMKASGIDVALPSINGVSLRWQAAVTKTKIKESAT